MKNFEAPEMQVQKLEGEGVIATSTSCFETFACTECYCGIVQCSGTYECRGLVCPNLSDFD